MTEPSPTVWLYSLFTGWYCRLAHLPQHWARKKYFRHVSVGDLLLAGGKCFVSDAGISDLISDH
jgi:hypothetical protein